MPRRLSICQVTAAYYPYPSGVTEYVHHLTHALRARGHSVRILTTNYDRLAGWNRTEVPVDPKVTRFGQAWLLPLNRSFATVPLDWHMSRRVKDYLARHRFDILHLNGFFPPDISFYALKHSQAVNVVMFHTVGFSQSRVASWFFVRLFSRYGKKLHGRIAATCGARDFIAPFFPGEIRVIHEGVDLTRFRPAPSQGASSGPRILFVGRLDARKGVLVLIHALVLIRSRFPRVQLSVVGQGPMESAARGLVARLGLESNVSFAGYVPARELPGYYASADVFCAPSLGGEAFGIVLLEAMASGLPVVASNITGYNEIVRNDVDGLLVPAGDSNVLAQALSRILADDGLRRKLGQNARARAQAHSWVDVAREVEDYYFELLAARR